MTKLYMMVFISLLTFLAEQSSLASSFKQAASLADAQNKEPASQVYIQYNLKPYYEKKYSPVFQSCLVSTEYADTSPFSFVVAIGKDGRVSRLYVDHETNIYACLRHTLEQDKFPAPPVSPYYMHISMSFSK